MAKRKLPVTADLPSNSVASRTEKMAERKAKIEVGRSIVPEKRRPIVRHQAIVKKKTLVQSIASMFVAGNTESVFSYVLNDVLLPAAKSTIQEMITSGIDMMLFGETRSHGRSSRASRSTISYGNFYQRSSGGPSKRSAQRHSSPRDRFGLEDIYFRHGDEATEVLDQMCEQLEDYGVVTVAEYFDLASVEGATWAHNKYGWDDLSKAYCTHEREGYTIVLPTPTELD